VKCGERFTHESRLRTSTRRDETLSPSRMAGCRVTSIDILPQSHWARWVF
jgi:hypothetical protein